MPHRFFVDVRDEDWFVGDTPIRIEAGSRSGYILTKDTAAALGIPTFDRNHHNQFNFKGSWHYYRQHKCCICSRLFIGFHAARACSDECAATALKARLAALAEKQRSRWRPRPRAIPRAERRLKARTGLKCDACGKPLGELKRPKRFCCDACRKWRHRHGWGMRRTDGSNLDTSAPYTASDSATT